MAEQFFIYILTNWNNKVIYTGVTNNLVRRIYEHRNKVIDGFTKKYNLSKLVYFEQTHDIISAINREKEIKIGKTWQMNYLFKMSLFGRHDKKN